jgi:molybdopterin synthase catalytic subunit
VDLFIGTTRQWTDSKETLKLEYECYPAMARAEIERLLAEVQARWPVQRACVFHRLGEVPVAEASVVIGVATPHRAEAFAATRYLIDTLKQQVPIWKREVYSDGETEWVEGDRPPSIRSSK